MFRKTALVALVAATLPATAGASTYVINPALSHVDAYVPQWIRIGEVFDVAVLPGETPPPTEVQWELRWQLTPFQVSGTFDASMVTSPVNQVRQRLQFDNVQIVTTAPAYAGFALPPALSVGFGGALTWSGDPCHDFDYFMPPGVSSSCTGFSFGPVRQDEGSFAGDAFTISGGQAAFFFTTLVNSPTQPPDVTDFSPAAGSFAYSIQATVVPEPAAWLTLLAGLGLLGFVRRGRARA